MSPTAVLPFSFPSHFSRLPSRRSLFFVLENQSSERRERKRRGDEMGGERGRLLLNGNGPNEQSPLHSAILRLICASPPSFAPSLVPFSADNTFGKRTRRRGRGGGRETRTQRRRRRRMRRKTLNKLCAIAAAGTAAAEGKHADDDICRKYAASPS